MSVRCQRSMSYAPTRTSPTIPRSWPSSSGSASPRGATWTACSWTSECASGPSCPSRWARTPVTATSVRSGHRARLPSSGTDGFQGDLTRVRGGYRVKTQDAHHLDVRPMFAQFRLAEVRLPRSGHCSVLVLLHVRGRRAGALVWECLPTRRPWLDSRRGSAPVAHIFGVSPI